MHLSDLAHPPVYRSIDECRVEVIWDRMRFEDWKAEQYRKDPSLKYRVFWVGILDKIDTFFYRIWRWVGLRRDWVDIRPLTGRRFSSIGCRANGTPAGLMMTGIYRMLVEVIWRSRIVW